MVDNLPMMSVNKNGSTLIDNLDVEDVFSSYPSGIRSKLLEVRQLILETASKTEGDGEIEELLDGVNPVTLLLKSKVEVP